MHLGVQFFKYKIEFRVIDLQRLDQHIRKLKVRQLFNELNIDNIRPDDYEFVEEVRV